MKKTTVATPKIVKIHPQNVPNSHSIFIGLAGDATYTQASSSGGWQTVDRPKHVAATQWFDRPVWSLALTGIMSSDISTYHSATFNSDTKTSIESDCILLESWLDKVRGTIEPPVFRLEGPIPGRQHYWVIYSLEFDEALRDPVSGYRYQQGVKLTFYEYQPPFGSKFNNIGQSHVENYFYNTETGNQSIKMYQIGAGDTLRSIANRFHLGSDGVSNLKTLNGIRDSRNIVVGQTIMIPYTR